MMNMRFVLSALFAALLTSCSHVSCSDVASDAITVNAVVLDVKRSEDIYDDGRTLIYEEMTCQSDQASGGQTFTFTHGDVSRMKRIKRHQKLRLTVKKKAWASPYRIISDGDVVRMGMVP